MDSGFENSDFPPDKDALSAVSDSNDVSSSNQEPCGQEQGIQERGGIVTARGTGEGLVIRLDGRIERSTLMRALSEFLTARRTFLGGQEVSLEWVGSIPVDPIVKEVEELLSEEFGIRVVSSRAASVTAPNLTGNASGESSGVARSLFDGAKNMGLARASNLDSPDDTLRSAGGAPASRLSYSVSRDAIPRDTVVRDNFNRVPQVADSFRSGLQWDDPDARLINATLRSGQKIESEHSVVIFGDVNSGAEIVAGGDIVVLGSLRGVAHAGAYDETGGGRVIFALNLQPTQLRIGSIISRGSVDVARSSMEQSSMPEIARVEGALIAVEPYPSRSAGARSGGGRMPR